MLIIFPVGADCINASNHLSSFTKGATRFRSFEPNYFVYRWSEEDDAALRAHFSVSYLSCEYGNDAPVFLLKNTEVFFSYTGEFDYYVNTRPSGPVVNRINNPAIHLRKFLENIDWIDFSFEHKSDGQSTEVTFPRDVERAELAFIERDFRYFDTISRGSNYFGTEIKVKNDLITSFVKLKIYESMNSAITWGNQKGKGITIADYDRLTTVLRANIGNGEISLDWTIGDKLFKTDSWNADYLISKEWPVPLYFRAHYGPLYTLSNYTKNENYFGVGVKLTPFIRN